MIYWLGEHFLVEFNVSDREHGQRNWVGCSREGREAQDSEGSTGVVAVGMGTGDQLEEEVTVLGSCYCEGR